MRPPDPLDNVPDMKGEDDEMKLTNEDICEIVDSIVVKMFEINNEEKQETVNKGDRAGIVKAEDEKTKVKKEEDLWFVVKRKKHGRKKSQPEKEDVPPSLPLGDVSLIDKDKISFIDEIVDSILDKMFENDTEEKQETVNKAEDDKTKDEMWMVVEHGRKKSQPEKEVKNTNNRFLHLKEDVPPSLPLGDVSLIDDNVDDDDDDDVIPSSAECKSVQKAKPAKRTTKEFNDADIHLKRTGQLPKSFFPILGEIQLKRQVRRKKEAGHDRQGGLGQHPAAEENALQNSFLDKKIEEGCSRGDPDLGILLLRSGNVELNPGPSKWEGKSDGFSNGGKGSWLFRRTDDEEAAKKAEEEARRKEEDERKAQKAEEEARKRREEEERRAQKKAEEEAREKVWKEEDERKAKKREEETAAWLQHLRDEGDRQQLESEEKRRKMEEEARVRAEEEEEKKRKSEHETMWPQTKPMNDPPPPPPRKSSLKPSPPRKASLKPPPPPPPPRKSSLKPLSLALEVESPEPSFHSPSMHEDSMDPEVSNIPKLFNNQSF